METEMSLSFPPFRLELGSEQLWQAEVVLPLRPKSFAVLRYLVEHAGQLVTKDDLLEAVWAGTVVSDSVLKGCIREVRQALSDDVQQPRYIATVHRRGYRFIAPLSDPQSQSEPPTGPGDQQGAAGETAIVRKLAAILSADVQGYSRLMGDDEAATIRTLTASREIIST